MERLDSDFLEKLIIKGLMTDKNFLVLITSTFEPNYFDDTSVSHIFKLNFFFWWVSMADDRYRSGFGIFFAIVSKKCFVTVHYKLKHW